MKNEKNEKKESVNNMDLQFNIGYNGRIEDLRVLLDKSDKIGSVYTGGKSDKIRGGRPQYIENLDVLSRQVQMAHDRGVSFEIALNAPCGSPASQEPAAARRLMGGREG